MTVGSEDGMPILYTILRRLIVVIKDSCNLSFNLSRWNYIWHAPRRWMLYSTCVCMYVYVWSVPWELWHHIFKNKKYYQLYKNKSKLKKSLFVKFHLLKDRSVSAQFHRAILFFSYNNIDLVFSYNNWEQVNNQSHYNLSSKIAFRKPSVRGKRFSTVKGIRA